MYRSRSDGNKFQQEVDRGLNRLSIPNFPVRLHTNAVRSISDFIIFSEDVIILEVKETQSKSFSMNTMQQKDLAIRFQDFYKDLIKHMDQPPQYRLVILVHFISYNKYMYYDFTDNKLAILHVTDTCYPCFDNLTEALQDILGGGSCK